MDVKPRRVTLPWTWRISRARPRQATPARVLTPVTTTRKVAVVAQLQDSEEFTLSVEATDSQGNPVPDAGTRTWTLEDPAGVGALIDNGDGSQTFRTTGAIGTATVTVTDQEPDNPDGTPGAQFLGSLAVDVVAGPVAEIVVTAGPARPRSA